MWLIQVGKGVIKFKIDQWVVLVLYWKYYFGKGEGVWQDYIEVVEEDVVVVFSIVLDEFVVQYFINFWIVYGFVIEIDVFEGGYFFQIVVVLIIGWYGVLRYMVFWYIGDVLFLSINFSFI